MANFAPEQDERNDKEHDEGGVKFGLQQELCVLCAAKVDACVEREEVQGGVDVSLDKEEDRQQ